MAIIAGLHVSSTKKCERLDNAPARETVALFVGSSVTRAAASLAQQRRNFSAMVWVLHVQNGNIGVCPTRFPAGRVRRGLMYIIRNEPSTGLDISPKCARAARA